MGAIELRVQAQSLPFREPFRISGYVFDAADVVTVLLSDGARRGRGEASGVYYLGDDVPNILATIERFRTDIEALPSREDLRRLMPPGGARNAIDAALWELEAIRMGASVAQLAGIAEPMPVRTTFTIGADEPAMMARSACGYSQAQAIKMKLTGELDLDIERVRAVRRARPDVWLGVDGNQGFCIGDLYRLVAALVDEDVALLEQPLPRGRDADLEGFASPLPLAGDESILTLSDVTTAPGRFDVVNIKLDKCGGLTEGLLMAAEARRLGLGVMVGTMMCSSLGTAPGFILGQVCDLVDLDGPTFLSTDVEPSVTYNNGMLFAGSEVWGAAASGA